MLLEASLLFDIAYYMMSKLNVYVANFRTSVNCISSLQMTFWVQDNLELFMEVCIKELYSYLMGRL